MARFSRLFLVLALVALPASGCQALLGQATEFDYLNGDMGPRYLADYLKPDPLAPLGDLSTYTRRDPQVLRAFEKARGEAQDLDAITNVHEDLFFVVQDEEGLAYTVSIHNGEVDLWEGLRQGVVPTMVVPLTRSEALELPSVLSSHGVDSRGRAVTGLSADGLFRLEQLLLLPALQAYYSRPDLYPHAGDRRALKIDDFVQLEVTPPDGSSAVPARVTILNIDGQWLFLQGWHGEPDERLKLTPLQALALYQAAVYAPRQAQTTLDKQLAERHARELWDQAISYTRSSGQ